MENVLTILGSAAVGGILSFVGVFLTNAANLKNTRYQLEHEAKQKERERLQEKGEELYALIEKWQSVLLAKYTTHAPFVRGEVSRAEAMHNLHTIIKEFPYDFQRIELLTDIYFPEAKEAYAKATTALSSLNRIEEEIKRGEKKPSKECSSAYSSLQDALQNYGEEFKRLVAKLIRES